MDDDYAISLIRSRCEGALTEVELAEIEAAIRQQPPPVMLDSDTAGKLTMVLDMMERRLDEITASLAERDEARAIAQEAQEIEASFIDAAGETLN